MLCILLIHEPSEVYLELLRDNKAHKIMLRTDKKTASFFYTALKPNYGPPAVEIEIIILAQRILLERNL